MTHEIFEEGLLNPTGSTTFNSNDSLSITFFIKMILFISNHVHTSDENGLKSVLAYFLQRNRKLKLTASHFLVMVMFTDTHFCKSLY